MSPFEEQPVLWRGIVVVGASSQVGHFLVPRLERRGMRITALSRQDRGGKPGSPLTWICTSTSGWADVLHGCGPHAAAIHLAPLPLLPPLLPELERTGVSRIIAFSTTGRFYKTASADATERAYVRSVIEAEAAVADRCSNLGIAWSVFRPTLVYGAGLDRNITTIVRFVRRFGFFPLFGGGRGLRQPVHADDLARACVDALGNPHTYGKAYNLSGGSTITFRDMAEAVFVCLQRTPRFVPVPLGLFRGVISLAKSLPQWRGLSTEMAMRQAIDMCFDHSEATKDFGFDPRPFHLDDASMPRT